MIKVTSNQGEKIFSISEIFVSGSKLLNCETNSTLIEVDNYANSNYN